MEFADIHIHALYGVDDGSKNEKETTQMLDAIYADGVRYLCFTPHFHPGYFGDNYEQINQAYHKIRSYANQRYPDLQLFLGNELRYDKGSISWLKEGHCRTMNHTRYVLVDFSERESEKAIIAGLEHLLNSGYVPILAHAERYAKLDFRTKRIREFKENGVWIQLDIQSLYGDFGLAAARRAKAILSNHLADFVATDAHDLVHRPPGLSRGYRYISQNYGESYAAALFKGNALQILYGNANEEDGDGNSK